jgi:transposase
MHNHPNPRRFIGCDVGKSTLVFCEHGQAATYEVANTKADIAAFAKTLDASCLLVCEATGGHEALLLDIVTALGLAAHRADARRVKAFIRSHGVLGKTDAIDTRQLALYAKERHESLPLWQAPDPDRLKLQSLVLTRQDMVADRVAWSNRLKAPGADHAKAHMREILSCLEGHISAIEAEIKVLLKTAPDLARDEKVLAAIPGIGPTTAAALIALMPELGALGRRQAAALAGLAPHPRQSGASNAYRRTRGGRPLVKKAIFMAALNACQHNPQLRQTYQRLIKAGKKPIVALTAIMRKLIVIANAKLRDAATLRAQNDLS